MPVLEACESYLSILIKVKGKEGGLERDVTEKEIITYLFTLGEVAQVNKDTLHVTPIVGHVQQWDGGGEGGLIMCGHLLSK